ncbi:type II toxin-antitoxin system VapC family toxin [Microbacterium sp. 2MCAF23]|uniref:type II toxin-antitoxin system VapC family toxin n=1 Tax=Microbacterium sp. 2MCAF23 TaxID=3232985 RepID=UPI003F9B52A8
MYLVDTNTLSEARRAGHVGEEARRWMASVAPSSLFISVISDYELERGVLMLGRRDPRQAQALRRWLDGVRLELGVRILPITAEIARACAGINVPDRRPWADSLIAATALHHGLTVVTRNEKDFEVPGLAVVNPFSG